MFKSYREIFSYPGALRFSLAGAVARFPMAMAGLSTLLMISTLYGEYSLAGQVNALVVIAMAAASPNSSSASGSLRASQSFTPSGCMFPGFTVGFDTLVSIPCSALDTLPICPVIGGYYRFFRGVCEGALDAFAGGVA